MLYIVFYHLNCTFTAFDAVSHVIIIIIIIIIIITLFFLVVFVFASSIPLVFSIV